MPPGNNIGKVAAIISRSMTITAGAAALRTQEGLRFWNRLPGLAVLGMILVALLETAWVLRSRYGLPKNRITEAISGLLDATDVRFEDEPVIEEALFNWKDTTADFADCMIVVQNRRLGCRATATFNVKAPKLTGFMAA